jgi:oligopeptidase B
MKNTLVRTALCVIFASSFTNTKHNRCQIKVNSVAKIIPKSLEKHNETRIDNYFWLNDRENPEVIDYLNKENTYYDAMTAHKRFSKKILRK